LSYFFKFSVHFFDCCQRYNKNSNGLKCSYFEVIEVTQFFEFFQFKNNKAKFKKFCGLRFAKPTLVKQLAIIVFIDC